jgi:Zn-dependent protease
MDLFNGFQLDSLLYRIAALLLAIVVHDAVQAGIATLLFKDTTAKDQGRLSLNPLAHISTIGLLPVLFGPFGWSRPVPVASTSLPGKQAIRATIIYASGPVANLLMGLFLWWLTFRLPVSASDSMIPAWSLELLRGILQWSYIGNMMFFLIHLLPLHPMDLWKILRRWFPAAWGPWLVKNEKFGIAILIGLFVTPFGQLMFQKSFEWLSSMVMNMYAIG